MLVVQNLNCLTLKNIYHQPSLGFHVSSYMLLEEITLLKVAGFPLKLKDQIDTQ